MPAMPATTGTTCQTKRRRIGICGASKAAICKKKRDCSSMKLADIQEWAKTTLGLDIPRSTLGDILKDSEKWLGAGKENDTTLRERSGREASLEEPLLTWFTDIRNRAVPVSDAMLIEKARLFGGKLDVPSTFMYSKGWLHRFKQRHGLRRFILQGESDSVDHQAVDVGRGTLRSTLGGFAHDDVYNLDETSLFYKLGPSTTLSTPAGTDKRQPVVTGKSKRPRCFGMTFDPAVYCDYYSNRKAWMTTAIFQTVLKKLDRDMRLQGRRVILVIDNATCHSGIGLELSNVELCFLPKNTTSHLQPLDAGIIKAFKAAYHRDLVSLLVDRAEQGEEMAINCARSYSRA
ncbi:tigger transposable element-derived protein 6-like [Ornithodoros turicata]|uniref:tigger transposable element-derived protein 6-like n=1 Tax=Ornithodoros turicata TaxID=34597 RepID=UPI0031391B1E